MVNTTGTATARHVQSSTSQTSGGVDATGQLSGHPREKLTVGITGVTGMVGGVLAQSLTRGGHQVRRIIRSRPQDGDVLWDPSEGVIAPISLEGIDCVVHLAGENIASGRWTEAKKQQIRDSRVDGTRRLCEALAKMKRRPTTLISASATGYYGNSGDTVVAEESSAGHGFLPEVCVEWERATQPAEEAGIRVVHMRIGIVLSPLGGALQKMLLPFKLGLGGNVGHGGQYWSWVSLPDLVGMIEFAIGHSELRGPVNAVAPGAVTNREFTRVLGRVLHRPTLFPMPALAARLALGEMADALLMASTRVAPVRLREAGYNFLHPDLESALRSVLFGEEST